MTVLSSKSLMDNGKSKTKSEKRSHRVKERLYMIAVGTEQKCHSLESFLGD